MVLITDAAGAIEYVNEEFTEVTGYTLEEVRGRTPSILNAGETAPDFYQDMWRTIQSGEDWHGEMRNRTKSGQPYWTTLSISPFWTSPMLLRIILVSVRIYPSKGHAGSDRAASIL